MELDDIKRSYQANRTRQINFYSNAQQKASNTSHYGYVISATPQDKLNNRYSVTVPRLNITLNSVPLAIPGAQNFANGTGYKPFPLRAGQPVIIKFTGANSTEPYIESALPLNGDPVNWEDTPPTIDDTDKKTGAALYPTPFVPESLTSTSDLQAFVYPLIKRSNSPVHGEESPAGIELPGAREVFDALGNFFQYIPGQYVQAINNIVEEATGARLSLADKPNVDSHVFAHKTRADFKQAQKFWQVSYRGKLQPVEIHPANPTTSLTQAGSFSTLLNPLPSQLPVFGQAQGILENIKQVQSVFSKFQLSKIASLKQLDFLSTNLLSKTALLEQNWGNLTNIGLSVLGKQSSFPLTTPPFIGGAVKLPFEGLSIPKLPLSIPGFDPGGANVNATIAGGATGDIPTLSTEGQLILKGLANLLDVINNRQGKRSSPPRSQSELNEVVTPRYDAAPPVYQYVSTEQNNLDFANNPAHRLASFLTGYGVDYAGAFVKHSHCYVTTGSPLELIKSVQYLAEPLIFAILEVPSLILESKKEEVIFFQDNPTIPVVPSSVIEQPKQIALDRVAEFKEREGQLTCAGQQDFVTTILSAPLKTANTDDLYREVLLVEPPKYIDWLFQPDAFIDWLEKEDPSLAQVATNLLDQNLALASAHVLKYKTGLDITLFPKEWDRLQTISNQSYQVPQRGLIR